MFFDKFLAGLVTVPQLVKYANEIGLRIHRLRKIGGKPLLIVQFIQC